MPIATLRELLGELDRALAYTEDLQVGLTPEQDRGDLPPLSRIREHRSVVAERLHHRIGQIDRGAVGAPNQLRVIASTLLIALVNHEYQHSKVDR